MPLARPDHADRRPMFLTALCARQVINHNHHGTPILQALQPGERHAAQVHADALKADQGRWEQLFVCGHAVTSTAS